MIGECIALEGTQRKYLVCFDFDETMTEGHTHNYLMDRRIRPRPR